MTAVDIFRLEPQGTLAVRAYAVYRNVIRDQIKAHVRENAVSHDRGVGMEGHHARVLQLESGVDDVDILKTGKIQRRHDIP